MLPCLHQLTLAPHATDALLDDPELQGAIEVFTRILVDSADDPGLSPRERAWRICRNLAVVNRISKGFVPDNFYQHYAVQLEIPGAASWIEAETENHLLWLTEWCAKVKTATAATSAAQWALRVFPNDFDEVVWLAKRGADVWKVLTEFMRRAAALPLLWNAAQPGTPSEAENNWNRLVQAYGGAAALAFAVTQTPVLAKSAYLAVATSGNLAAMQTFQATFGQSLTTSMRTSIARELHGGQVAQAQELIALQTQQHIAAGMVNDMYLRRVICNCAESLARNSSRPPATPFGTPFTDSLVLSQTGSAAQYHDELMVGACMGLRDVDAGEVASYVTAYYNPQLMNAEMLARLLRRLLGERLATHQEYFRYCSEPKFRALVRAVGPANIPAMTANRLLWLAAGDLDRADSTHVNPPMGTQLFWEVSKVQAVVGELGPNGFGTSAICNAIALAFLNIPADDGMLRGQAILDERLPVLEQLVACLPANAGTIRAVHISAARAISDLYAAVFHQYLQFTGMDLGEQAGPLAVGYTNVCNVFANAGIDLANIPDAYLANTPLMRLVGRIRARITLLEDRNSGGDSPGGAEEIRSAQNVQAQIAYGKRLLAPLEA